MRGPPRGGGVPGPGTQSRASCGPRGLARTEWKSGGWRPPEAGPAGGLHGWGSPRVLTYGLGPGASEPSGERKATPAPWGAELSLTSLGSL